MQIQPITYDEVVHRLSWTEAVEALRAGHLLPRAQIADMLLGPADGGLLSRGAYIEGLGFGVKSVTVFDRNPAFGLPTVQGAMLVFEPRRGRLDAIIDSRVVTEFKTAADSVLGALLLARPDSRRLLVVGAGTVARSLVPAYSAALPSLRRVSVWARRPEQAEALVAEFADQAIEIAAAPDLAATAGDADIISCATMARDPVLKGAWIRPGTHVDLIGAYRTDMREADDDLISGGSLYVDSRETTVDHVGELTIPIASGVISAGDVLGDLYDLVPAGASARRSEREITIFKNGGGAHLDLMMASYIRQAAGRSPQRGPGSSG